MRLEIERAPNGLVRVKTYINGRLTHVTGSLAYGAAQKIAEDSGCEVVDHTAERPEEGLINGDQ